MIQQKKNAKKQRNKPCKPRGVDSKGARVGAKRTRLDEVTKAQMGKGIYRSFRPIGSVRHA